MTFAPSLPPTFNTAWQSTQTAAQQWSQQTLAPAAQYVQTTWQGGLTPVENRTIMEKLKQIYIKNLAMELALKAELARRSGFPRVAAELERQRQGILGQLQQNTFSLAFNTIAPNPLTGVNSQWQLTQALAIELASKGIGLKDWLFENKP